MCSLKNQRLAKPPVVSLKKSRGVFLLLSLAPLPYCRFTCKRLDVTPHMMCQPQTANAIHVTQVVRILETLQFLEFVFRGAGFFNKNGCNYNWFATNFSINSCPNPHHCRVAMAIKPIATRLCLVFLLENTVTTCNEEFDSNHQI